MIHKLTFFVDDLDFQAIRSALLHRKAWDALPDAEPGSTEHGILLAEICRGWMERCGYTWPHPDDETVVETTHE